MRRGPAGSSPRTRLRGACFAAILLPAIAGAAPGRDAAEAASRGELLYGNHCQGCHTSVLHVRSEHRATSVADVYGWVRHWSDYQKLGWSDDDVASVTDFLARRYYRFEPPPAMR